MVRFFYEKYNMPTKFIDLPPYVTPIIDIDKIHVIKTTGDFNIDIGSIVNHILPVARSNWLSKGANSLDIQTTVTSATQVASGDDTIVIGQKSSGRSTGGVAIGRENSLEPGSNNASIVGINNQVFSQNSVVFGRDLTVRGNDSVCIGYDQQIELGSHYGISIGSNNINNPGNYDVISIGHNLNTITSSNVINLGLTNVVNPNSNYSVNIGFENTISDGYDDSTHPYGVVCMGYQNEIVNSGTFIGTGILDFRNILDPQSYCVAIGRGIIIGESGTVCISAFGGSADSLRSTSIGYNTHSVGDYSIAIGAYSYTLDNSGIAIGTDTTATQNSSVAIGNDANSNGENSTAIGAISFVNKNWVYNISGLSIIRADRLESVALGNEYCAHLYSGSEQIICSNEIDLSVLGTTTVPLTTGVHFFPTEVGIICLTSTGVFLQPEISFGDGVILDSLVSINFTTNMSDVNKRQKYITLNDDSGLTSLSATITQPVIGSVVTGRFYWKGFVIEDKDP